MSDRLPIQHALIMAAGRGNRMRPLTDMMPKAMLPYNGSTLIGNNLLALHRCVKYVHVTVGYKSAMLAQYLMTVGVDSIFNTDGYNNSWWISHTLLRHLDEPMLVLTCDNITELDLGFLTDEYYRLGAPACMVVPVIPLPGIDGDYIEHTNGMVTSIQRQTPSEIYCSGIQVLNPRRVTTVMPDTDAGFYAVWDRLIEKRQVGVSAIYPKAWFSVDTLEQLANLPK